MNTFLLIFTHLMGLVIGWCLCEIAHLRWPDADQEADRG